MSRVLIVDDDPAVGRLLGIILKCAGHEAEAADEISEAGELLQSWDPDVVLLDLWIGNQDGRELFRTARDQGFSTPFIVLSAYEAKRASDELGAQGWLDKPFEIETLLGMVQNYSSGRDGNRTSSSGESGPPARAPGD